MELRSGRKTGSAAEAAASPRGDGSGGGGQSRHDTMAQVMSSLGATALDREQPQYVSKDVKTDCPMYVGMGQNGMGFKKWYDTRFTPRVWLPKQAEGEKARDNTLLQEKITAHTAWLRSRPRQRPQAAQPRDREEGDGETHSLSERKMATRQPTAVLQVLAVGWIQSLNG